MRAKNHTDLIRGYWKFSGYLVACVFTGVLIYFCYIRTSKVEVNRIVEKTEEYDKIYLRQIELSNRIDELYNHIVMFNTNKNDLHLLNSVSRQKQEILSSMEGMSSHDIRICQKLMGEVNVFLAIKDSIRLAKTEEEMTRFDLLRCVEENKQTSRRLTIGGITVNR